MGSRFAESSAGPGMIASASLATHWFAPAGLLRELPLVTEEHVEEAVVPLRRLGGPGDLEAAGDRVLSLAAGVLALPAEALRLERRALGLDTDQVGVAGTMGLAEGVAARDEGDGLLVVHRHPAEGLADVAGRCQRVGVAARTLGVHVDEAHLDRAQRLGKVALAAVPLVAQPGVLRPPEDLLRLPDVLTPEAEAERLEPHVLQRDVSGQDEQVCPRDRLAVLLLDRPQQPAGLVEVAVVGPAVERGEPLVAGAGAAAAVVDPVGAGRVPAQPDHQAAVVAEVGRPPVLRAAEDVDDVALERVDVEARERGGVVELLAQRVGRRRVLVQHPQVDLVGPPVLVAVRPAGLRRR